MRFYLHGARRDEIIQDLEGVEVDNINQVRVEILRAVRELLQEDEFAAEDWSGWRLIVTDDTGAVVLSLDLDTAAH
jgi:hypothetical protein